MKNNTIRTPEDRFENLPDYNFQPNYLELQSGLRMHYLDEGEKSNPVILLLHGEPSWSFLYRKMIPVLVKNGFRAIAPDLVGFGKSDKLRQQADYSYQKHIDWIKELLVHLELENISLFCQDWGGLIGLRIVAEMPDKFARVLASNTFLPTGQGKMPESFLKWQLFSQKSPDFDIGKVLDMGTFQPLSEEVIRAYNAPFPSEEYKAGSRIFPTLVPSKEDDSEAINNRKAWQTLMKWEKPFLTVFGSEDPIMFGMEKFFQKIVPGAKGQKHQILEAGHFIQEEKGEELAEMMSEFMAVE